MTSFDMNHGHALPDKNQQESTNTSQPNQQSVTTSEKLDTPLEIKAAKIGATATWVGAIGAAFIGIVGSALTGFILFQVTQHYQGNDGRQKALNEYVNSMKELIASTQVDRASAEKIAALAYSKTLLAMRELDEDGDRKGQALRFLHENCLVTIDKKDGKVPSLCGTRQDIKNGEKFNLHGANLNGIILEDTWVPNVNLRKVYMKGANLQNADLSGADLREANISPNQKSVWWGNLPFPKGTPGNAILRNTKLSNADLTKANLRNADLSQAELSSTNLSQADLRFANLVGANLDGANLTSACYIAGTETTYFPSGFDPKKAGMVPMTKEESNPQAKDTYKPCFSPSNP